jgi:hypothetical protein
MGLTEYPRVSHSQYDSVHLVFAPLGGGCAWIPCTYSRAYGQRLVHKRGLGIEVRLRCIPARARAAENANGSAEPTHAGVRRVQPADTEPVERLTPGDHCIVMADRGPVTLSWNDSAQLSDKQVGSDDHSAR